jgi:hypothetical protein
MNRAENHFMVKLTGDDQEFTWGRYKTDQTQYEFLPNGVLHIRSVKMKSGHHNLPDPEWELRDTYFAPHAWEYAYEGGPALAADGSPLPK